MSQLATHRRCGLNMRDGATTKVGAHTKAVDLEIRDYYCRCQHLYVMPWIEMTYWVTVRRYPEKCHVLKSVLAELLDSSAVVGTSTGAVD